MSKPKSGDFPSPELKVGRISPPFLGEREKYFDRLKIARPDIPGRGPMLEKLEQVLRDPQGDIEYAKRMIKIMNATEVRDRRLTGRSNSPIEIEFPSTILKITPFQEQDSFQFELVIK